MIVYTFLLMIRLMVSCILVTKVRPQGVDLLSSMFNAILSLEYVPVYCWVGIQVPLYKANYTCVLNLNNYRGITLLSVSKMCIEVLTWKEMKI